MNETDGGVAGLLPSLAYLGLSSPSERISLFVRRALISPYLIENYQDLAKCGRDYRRYRQQSWHEFYSLAWGFDYHRIYPLNPTLLGFL